MKKFLFLFIPLAAILLHGCAPVYTCGDAVPGKVQGSKRLKTVVTERDVLCNNLALKIQENETLKTEINSLSNKNADLSSRYTELNTKNDDLISKNAAIQKRYESLINESLSQTDQFNKTLQAKSEELSNKEKMLSEREKALQELQVVIARQDSITKRLNDILRNALLGFNADELSVEIKNGKVYVSMTDRLLFKSGSATVETKGKEALKLLADVLDKNPDIEILVEGHTDNVPIKTALFKDNWDLSVARATSIVRILTDDYKIIPTRVTASGRGEFLPKAENDTSEGRAKNRRTEIILSPNLDEIMKLINSN